MTDRPLSDDVFFVGHSLVGFDMPAFTEHFIEAGNGTGTVDQHIINGAPLKYQWENASAGQGTSLAEALPSGEYEAVVLTEAVPLRNHLQRP